MHAPDPGPAPTGPMDPFLSQALDKARDAKFGILPDARIFYVNEAACRSLGYSREELLGLSVPDLDPNFPMARWASHWEEVRSAGTLLVESLHRRKDGGLIPVEISITMLRVGAEERLFASARDNSWRASAEAALRASEARFRTIFENEPECVKVVAPDGTLLDMNPAGLAMLEVDDPSQAIGHPITEWVPPEQLPAFLSIARRVMQGETVEGSFQMVGGRGTRRWMETRAAPWRDGEGAVGGLLAVTRDISARKRAEEELVAAEQRYRGLFETMAQGVVYQDAEGRITAANPAAERILGLSLAQMMGLTSMDPRWGVIHPDGSPFPGQDHPAMVALRTGQPVRDVLMGIFHPGTERHRWALVSAVPETRPGEEGPWQVFATLTDVTELTDARQALETAERRLRTVVSNSDAVIFQLDPEGRFLLSEGRGLAGLGLRQGQVVGLSALEMYKDFPEILAALRTGLDGKSARGLTEIQGKVFDNFITPVLDEGGRVESVIGIATDITEKVRMERALRDSEARFRLMAESLPVVLYELRQEGESQSFTYVSERIQSLAGITATRMTADPEAFFDLVHPEDLPGLRAAGAQAAAKLTPLSVEFRLTRPDGELRWIHAERLPRASNSLSSIWSGYLRDITEQRRAAQALRDSEASYRGLFDSVGEAIYIQDSSGHFLDVNRGAEEMYGYTREELVGQSPALVSAPGRNNIPDVMRCVERAFAGEPQQFEFWGLRKNGEVFPKEVRLYRGTYFGQKVVIAIATDITERRRTEDAFRQAQKLESLGILAGGIAHDFNNLLTAIMGNLNLAQDLVGEHGGARPLLDKVEQTVVRASDLSRQMLAYSGKGHFVIRPQDLNQIVREMTGLLQVSLPKKVHLDLQLASSLPLFRADAAQIQQVVMNLVTNAGEAIGDQEGHITVATFMADLDREVLTAGFPGQSLDAGTYLVLSVTDTGCGISPDIRSRIFDPFFTTKSSGRGLGLSAMLGILRGHEAGIRIQSEVGQGSTFEVFFPAGDGLERLEEIEPTPSRRRRAGTILLVDDEEMILEATGAALEAQGFRVVRARDGVQAMERFMELGSDLALVFMDLSMPRMDGTAAFLAMHHSLADVPVILTSGYDQKEASEDLQALGLAGFVQKPYRFHDLAREIDRVLGST
ncbi:MAG: PAS domain S-box protein [Acidobacteria bacterium]|nr:PAS domain S-box protein [Acidobacteriota bacterium]